MNPIGYSIAYNSPQKSFRFLPDLTPLKTLIKEKYAYWYDTLIQKLQINFMTPQEIILYLIPKKYYLKENI